jgi:hypothetical protein
MPSVICVIQIFKVPMHVHTNFLSIACPKGIYDSEYLACARALVCVCAYVSKCVYGHVCVCVCELGEGI